VEHLRTLLQRFTEYDLDQAYVNGRTRNLECFLEALQGFLTDLDGYYANRGQQPPARPDWSLFATALIAATSNAPLSRRGSALLPW